MKTTPEDKFEKLLGVGPFKDWFANRWVVRDGKRLPLATYWLQHPQRRQYEGLEFAPGKSRPGYFNLWRGFAVQPRQGDCSKFLAHLKDNVCAGDEEIFHWVVGWFASIFQRPDKKFGTSLALRGKQGAGKTIVGRMIGSLLGDHYALLSDPRYITGRFNSHMNACLLLHADEAFWAGDRAAEGRLKDLVTGDLHFVEFKGKEPVRLQNHIRLFITGNHDWIVPAGHDERRFAVLDVGDDHMQDTPYFAAIDEEMDNGGREALLHYLLTFDLSGVDLRAIPRTAALLQQKISSLNSLEAWWLDVLQRGELPWGCQEERHCPANRLFDGYIKSARSAGVRRRSIETQVGHFLNTYVPGLVRTKAAYEEWRPVTRTTGSGRGKVYVFPPLSRCRDAFQEALGQEIRWPDGDTDWTRETAPYDDGEIPF
jgi:Family of unknown function (DUF5906)